MHVGKTGPGCAAPLPPVPFLAPSPLFDHAPYFENVPLALLRLPCSCIPSDTPPDSQLELGLSLFAFAMTCPFATILPAISTALTMADDVSDDNFFFLRGGWPPQEVPVDAAKLVSLSILRKFTKLFGKMFVLLLRSQCQPVTHGSTNTLSSTFHQPRSNFDFHSNRSLRSHCTQ